jgi:flagellar motor switch protein FliM
MTDGFLGGDSVKCEERQEITAIEERILFRTCDRILRHFERSLPRNLKYSFEIKEVIKKAENFEIHSLDDLVTTIHFDVTFADNQGGIMLGFPSFLLEPVLKKGLKKIPQQEKKPPSQDSIEARARRLNNVPLDCKVVLSGINIRLKDDRWKTQVPGYARAPREKNGGQGDRLYKRRKNKWMRLKRPSSPRLRVWNPPG